MSVGDRRPWALGRDRKVAWVCALALIPGLVSATAAATQERPAWHRFPEEAMRAYEAAARNARSRWSTLAARGSRDRAGLRGLQAADYLRRLDRQVARFRDLQTPDRTYAVFQPFEPLLSCERVDRVGRLGDGGKYVCNGDLLARRPCVVYSFGGSDDLSFELEMNASFGCTTRTFDPTPGLAERMQPQLKPGMTYHAVGLGPTTLDPSASDPYALRMGEVTVRTRSLSSIAGELGDSHVDLLKIDIEGGEWSALPQLLNDPGFERLGVQQMQIEFHWARLSEAAPVFAALLRRGYAVFAREVNPADTACWEFAFVRDSFLLGPPPAAGSGRDVQPRGAPRGGERREPRSSPERPQ